MSVSILVSLIFSLLSVYLSQCWAWECPVTEPVTLLPNRFYIPLGKIVTINGISIYETGNASSKNLLIGITDIYGLDSGNTNIMQISDILADGRNKVILPDFFQHKPWYLTKKQPVAEKDPEFTAFLESHSWESNVRDELKKILDHYKSAGFTNLGLFGFSYGGQKVIRASDEYANDFKVALQFTPAPIFRNEVNLINIPTFLVSSKFFTEEVKEEFCDIVQTNHGKGSCTYLFYPDMIPGFLGTEGNWNDPHIRTIAEEAIGKAQTFLCDKFLS